MNVIALLLLSAPTVGASGAPVATLAWALAGQDEPPLAEGNPPLTKPVAEAWRRLVEFAFDATLTNDQSEQLQKQLIARWQEADSRARNEVLRAPMTYQQVSEARGPRRELMRLELREEMLAAAEADREEPANELLLELWNAKSPVLAPGDPPLRRSSARALSSLLEWLVSRGLGQEVELSEAERDEFMTALVREYATAAPGDRTLLAGAEAVLAWIKLEWEQAGPEARARFEANVGQALGVTRSFLPAPFAGEVDTFRQPDGLFEVSYPREWPARYGAPAAPVTVAEWALADVTVLGEAPAEALELGALPTAGALLIVGLLPEAAREGRMPLGEAMARLSAELLGLSGEAQPVAESSAGPNAALLAWRQLDQGTPYNVWVSAVVLPEPPGTAVVTVTRAPAEQAQQYEPAFSRIIHSLRLGSSGQEPPLPGAPNPQETTSELLSRPLGEQMDLVEGLSKGVR